jgi:hypothetical protein
MSSEESKKFRVQIENEKAEEAMHKLVDDLVKMICPEKIQDQYYRQKCMETIQSLQKRPSVINSLSYAIDTMFRTFDGDDTDDETVEAEEEEEDVSDRHERDEPRTDDQPSLKKLKPRETLNQEVQFVVKLK